MKIVFALSLLAATLSLFAAGQYSSDFCGDLLCGQAEDYANCPVDCEDAGDAGSFGGDIVLKEAAQEGFAPAPPAFEPILLVGAVAIIFMLLAGYGFVFSKPRLN